MTVNSLLKNAVEILSKNNIDGALNDARIILSFCTKKSKTYLMVHGDFDVSDEVCSEFFSLVERRSHNEPIAYITKKKEFMGIEFNVCDGVLIPRPDTEVLVNKVIDFIDKKPCMVLDIGCGSGAISVSVATFCENAQVVGIDVSNTALGVCSKNKGNLKNISFLKHNIFEDSLENRYDVIVSNPPYIKTDDIGTLMADVKNFEPHLALDGGDDGLLFYRHIIKSCKKNLNSGGLMAFECGINQADFIALLFAENGFENITKIKDPADIERVVCAIKK